MADPWLGGHALVPELLQAVVLRGERLADVGKAHFDVLVDLRFLGPPVVRGVQVDVGRLLLVNPGDAGLLEVATQLRLLPAL